MCCEDSYAEPGDQALFRIVTAQRIGGSDVFEVVRMFHPSFHVLDLDDAERWYENVFGLDSTRLSTGPVDPDNRTDYSTFTLIRDVLVDSIDPKLFVKDGVQQYPTIDATSQGVRVVHRRVARPVSRGAAKGIRFVGNLGEEGT